MVCLDKICSKVIGSINQHQTMKAMTKIAIKHTTAEIMFPILYLLDYINIVNNIMSKTKLEEINRNIYDIKNKDEYDFKIKKGLTKEIIEEISDQKNDPDWMREFRLKALEVYNKLELPTWGPSLLELNMDEAKNRTFKFLGRCSRRHKKYF